MKKIGKWENLRIFSGSMLKLIAVISMLCDHSAILLSPALPFMDEPIISGITAYYILRRIGRLAFPIYCFLIGEGFAHTGNKRRYTLNLLVFALISELPFNLLVSGELLCAAKQNVFFTLFFGALMLYLCECAADGLRKTCLLLAVLAVAVVSRADYGVPGVVLILLMYVLRKQPAVQAIAAYPLLSGGLAAFAAFIPINLYNGKRGFIQTPVLKYAFYVFYPAHILALLLIRHLLRSL